MYLIQSPLREEIEFAVLTDSISTSLMNRSGIDTSYQGKDLELVNGIYKWYLESLLEIKIKERI